MAVVTTKLTKGGSEVWKMTGFAASGDESAWIRLPKHTDRSVHALGTFAGGISLSVRGSNQADVNPPTAEIALRDSNETVIAITAADLVQILENSEWVQVQATAGAGGADVTVYLKAIRRP